MIIQWFYYFAIIEDLILRFGWAFLIGLAETGYMMENTLVCILAPLEVFRWVIRLLLTPRCQYFFQTVRVEFFPFGKRTFKQLR